MSKHVRSVIIYKLIVILLLLVIVKKKRKEIQAFSGFRRTHQCIFQFDSIVSVNSITSTALQLTVNFVEIA